MQSADIEAILKWIHDSVWVVDIGKDSKQNRIVIYWRLPKMGVENVGFVMHKSIKRRTWKFSKHRGKWKKTGPAFKNYYIHMWETPHMVILSKYIICCLSICIECMFPKGKTISVYLI